MWWIVIIAAVILFIFILLGILVSHIKNKGDYKDGGGNHVGHITHTSLSMSSTDKAGIEGENITNKELRRLLRNDEYLLTNLLLPLKNGKKTELDCVILSRKGLFCVETKNWKGSISGNDIDEYWIQRYDDPSLNDRKHRNPVTQNDAHCKILDRLLNNKYVINNVVIFVRLSSDNIESNYVYTLDEFFDYYRDLTVKLSIDDVKYIYNRLKIYIASVEELKRHKEDTAKRYH